MAHTHRRAYLAGILFGLLAYKPQVFILAPICLFAARDYRALLALAVTSLGLALLSVGIFGADIWWKFLAHLPAHAALILGNHLPSNRVPTVFVLVYKLTANATAAKAAQIIATLAAWALVYWVWRKPTNLFAKVLAFAVALPLSTPILLEYDLAIWALPAAMLLKHLWSRRGDWADWAALSTLWLLPSIIWYASRHGINPWALAIVALVPYVIRGGEKIAPTLKCKSFNLISRTMFF